MKMPCKTRKRPVVTAAALMLSFLFAGCTAHHVVYVHDAVYVWIRP